MIYKVIQDSNAADLTEQVNSFLKGNRSWYIVGPAQISASSQGGKTYCQTLVRNEQDEYEHRVR